MANTRITAVVPPGAARPLAPNPGAFTPRRPGIDVRKVPGLAQFAPQEARARDEEDRVAARQNAVRAREADAAAREAQRQSEKAAREAQIKARRDENSQREADYNTRNVRHYQNAHGDVVARLDPQGKEIHDPGEGPVQYDKGTGRAWRLAWDSTGATQQKFLDADKKWEPNKDDPGDRKLYRRNKFSPVESMDATEALRHDDPELRSAAVSRLRELEQADIKRQLDELDIANYEASAKGEKPSKDELKSAEWNAKSDDPELKAQGQSVLDRARAFTERAQKQAELKRKELEVSRMPSDQYRQRFLEQNQPAAGPDNRLAELQKRNAAINAEADALNRETEAFNAAAKQGYNTDEQRAGLQQQAQALRERREALTAQAATHAEEANRFTEWQKAERARSVMDEVFRDSRTPRGEIYGAARDAAIPKSQPPPANETPQQEFDRIRRDPEGRLILRSSKQGWELDSNFEKVSEIAASKSLNGENVFRPISPTKGGFQDGDYERMAAERPHYTERATKLTEQIRDLQARMTAEREAGMEFYQNSQAPKEILDGEQQRIHDKYGGELEAVDKELRNLRSRALLGQVPLNRLQEAWQAAGMDSRAAPNVHDVVNAAGDAGAQDAGVQEKRLAAIKGYVQEWGNTPFFDEAAADELMAKQTAQTHREKLRKEHNSPIGLLAMMGKDAVKMAADLGLYVTEGNRALLYSMTDNYEGMRKVIENQEYKALGKRSEGWDTIMEHEDQFGRQNSVNDWSLFGASVLAQMVPQMAMSILSGGTGAVLSRSLLGNVSRLGLEGATKQLMANGMSRQAAMQAVKSGLVSEAKAGAAGTITKSVQQSARAAAEKIGMRGGIFASSVVQNGGELIGQALSNFKPGDVEKNFEEIQRAIWGAAIASVPAAYLDMLDQNELKLGNAFTGTPVKTVGKNMWAGRGRFLKELGLSAVKEAGTGFGQEVLGVMSQRWTERIPFTEPPTPAEVERVVMGAIGEAIGGGQMSATTAAVNRIMTPVQTWRAGRALQAEQKRADEVLASIPAGIPTGEVGSLKQRITELDALYDAAVESGDTSEALTIRRQQVALAKRMSGAVEELAPVATKAAQEIEGDPFAQGVMAIASGMDMAALTKEQVEALGYKRDGEKLTPVEGAKLAVEPGPNGEGWIITDPAIAQVKATAPTAGALIGDSEQVARIKAIARAAREKVKAETAKAKPAGAAPESSGAPTEGSSTNAGENPAVGKPSAEQEFVIGMDDGTEVVVSAPTREAAVAKAKKKGGKKAKVVSAEPVAAPASKTSVVVVAEEQAQSWDRANKNNRAYAWHSGGNLRDNTTDADGLTYGGARGFDSAQRNGGDKLGAHGMSKAGTLSGGLRDLLGMLTTGLDPNRNGGELYTASLTAQTGGGDTTAGGYAYRDGPFILVGKPGAGAFTGKLEAVGAVLINEAHFEQAAAIRAAIHSVRPDIIVDVFSNAGAVTKALYSNSASASPAAPNAEAPKSPAGPLKGSTIAEAREQMRKLAPGGKLKPEDEKALTQLYATAGVFLNAFGNVFSGVRWENKALNSGGFQLDPNTNELVISLPDARSTAPVAKDMRRWALAAIVEEAIHSVSVKMLASKEVDYPALLEAIKKDAPKTYKLIRSGYRGAEGINQAHEFIRMVVQGRISLDVDGVRIDGELTEDQYTDDVLGVLKAILNAIRDFVRNMAGKVPPPVEKQLNEQAALIEQRLKELLAHEKAAPPTNTGLDQGAPLGQNSGDAGSNQEGGSGQTGTGSKGAGPGGTSQTGGKSQADQSHRLKSLADLVARPSAEIISELQKLPTYQERIAWLTQNGYIEPVIFADGKPRPMVDYLDRKVILMRIGNIAVPFYQSTGHAGKKNVKSMKWYPVFGINPDSGWINKGTETDINNYYNFPILAKIARLLDEGVGAIPLSESPYGYLTDYQQDLNSFNGQMGIAGLAPSRNSDVAGFMANRNRVLEAINDEMQQASALAKPASPAPETTKKPSQTITGSNGETAPEMPVPATPGEAPPPAKEPNADESVDGISVGDWITDDNGFMGKVVKFEGKTAVIEMEDGETQLAKAPYEKAKAPEKPEGWTQKQIANLRSRLAVAKSIAAPVAGIEATLADMTELAKVSYKDTLAALNQAIAERERAMKPADVPAERAAAPGKYPTLAEGIEWPAMMGPPPGSTREEIITALQNRLVTAAPTLAGIGHATGTWFDLTAVGGVALMTHRFTGIKVRARIADLLSGKRDSITAEDAPQSLPPPAAKPALTPEEQAVKDILAGILGGEIKSQEVGQQSYSADIPDAAFLPMTQAARALLKSGVDTPEKLAASLTKMGPAFRAFSESVWSMMRGSNTKLPAAPDWPGIYSALDTAPDSGNNAGNETGDSATQPGVGEENQAGEPPPGDGRAGAQPDEPGGEDSGDLGAGVSDTDSSTQGGKLPGGGGKRPRGPRKGAGTGGTGTLPAGPDTGDAGIGAGGRDSGGNLPPGDNAKSRGRGNYHLSDPKAIVGGGPKARFRKNQRALEVADDLRLTGKEPSPEELDALAAYTGWGSFGQALFDAEWDRPNPQEGWEAEDQWLRDHLGKQAWESARESIINAHYTDPPTVQWMWDIIRRMGFKGGRVLEPSMGIGNFYSLMPRDLMDASTLTGIELDPSTADIAKILHPRANIRQMRYNDSQTAENFYDLVIGNWPFDETPVPDRKYASLKPTLHDFFFLKALDQVRPGGLVVGITSSGTMDKSNGAVRRVLAQKAELVGSIRLPTGAFEEYAGTAVVTDILIFRKRPAPLLMSDDDFGWIKATKEDGEDFRTNDYYRKNPQNVLGRLEMGRSTFGRQGMSVRRMDDFPERLEEAKEQFVEGTYLSRDEAAPEVAARDAEDRTPQFSIVEKDGTLHQVQGDHLVPLQTIKKWTLKDPAKTAERMAEARAGIGLRDMLRQLLEAQRTNKPTAPHREKLKAAFTAFRKEYGKLRKSRMLAIMENAGDRGMSGVIGLEMADGKPAAILERDITRPRAAATEGNVEDAYAVARNQAMEFDLQRVADLAKLPLETVRDRLMELNQIYLAPTGEWQVSDVYLSGNVRRKLREAEDAKASGNADMDRNIEALKAILPLDVPYYSIEARMGAGWVPVNDYLKFFTDILGVQWGQLDVVRQSTGWLARIEANTYAPQASTWLVPRDSEGVSAITSLPTINDHMNAAMNGTSINVYDEWRDEDGDHRAFNAAATEIANDRVERMRDAFQQWLWSDQARTARLQAEYNESFNAHVTPKRDGSHLRLEGLALTLGNGPFDFREHQRNAVWRFLLDGKGMAAHEVGTGKTFTMAGLIMEGKRLGRFSKPIVFAHNANSESVAADFQLAYPGGKFLYIDNLSPETRNATLQQIALDDWDAVIVPHSLIDRFALSRESMMMMVQPELDALRSEFEAQAEEEGLQGYNIADENALKDMAKAREGSRTAKQLVKAYRRIVQRLEKRALAINQDSVLFETLGLDAVLVDEAHIFKKISLSTRKEVKGLNKSESQAGFVLGMLTDYVKRQQNGKGVYLFTGTPVTNTLNEVYNMMRYVMDSDMKAAGVNGFDDWFNTFADKTTEIEQSSGGTYEAVERLLSFINVPELARLAGQFFDVVLAKDMPEFLPRSSPDGLTDNPVGRPQKQVRMVISEMSEAQEDLRADIKERYNQWKGLSKKERFERVRMGLDTPSRMDSEGLASALDHRYYDKDAPDFEGSKLNQAVRNIIEHYREHPSATQMVFMENGGNDFVNAEVTVRDPDGKPIFSADGKSLKRKERREKYNLFRDMVQKLVNEGVKPEEIAIFANMDLRPSYEFPEGDVLRKVRRLTGSVSKKDIADLMQSGEVRVAIGGSQTMGTGVNAQNWLRAIHHIDAPWMPGDLEQRNGRGWRQGNKWNTVFEYRYLTEGSHDGKKWQTLLNKVRFIYRFIDMLLGKGLDQRVLEGEGTDTSEGGAVADFAESFSAAAGDPRLLLRVKLEKAVSTLEKKKRMHAQAMVDAQNTLVRNDNYIESLTSTASDLASDMEAFKQWREQPFKASLVTPDGKATEYDKRDDLEKAIEAHFNPKTYAEKVTKGETTNEQAMADFRAVNGQHIYLRLGPFKVEQRGVDDYVIHHPSGQTTMVSRSLMSVEAHLRNMHYRQSDAARRLAQLTKAQEALRGSLGAPFARDAELTAKKAQLEQLERELALSPNPSPSWLRHGIPQGSLIFVREDDRLVSYDVQAHRSDDAGHWVLIEKEGRLTPLRYQEALDEMGVRILDDSNEQATPRRDALPETVQELRDLMASDRGWSMYSPGEQPSLPDGSPDPLYNPVEKFTIIAPGGFIVGAGDNPRAAFRAAMTHDQVGSFFREWQREYAKNQPPAGSVSSQSPADWRKMAEEMNADIDALVNAFQQGGPRPGDWTYSGSGQNIQTDAADQYWQDTHAPEKVAEWDLEATQMRQSMGDTNAKAMVLRKMTSGAMLTPAETRLAMQFEHESMSNLRTARDVEDHRKYRLAWRLSGRGPAQSMRARVDPYMKPAERARAFLMDLVFEPSDAAARAAAAKRAAAKQADDPKDAAKLEKEAERIEDESSRRQLEKLTADLKKSGFTLDEWLNTEVRITEDAPVFERLMREMGGWKAKVLRKLQGGNVPFKRIAKEVGRAERDVRAVRHEFEQKFTRWAMEQLHAGMTADDLVKLTEGGIKSQSVGAMSDEDKMKIIAEAMMKMGIVPPDKQGKAKVRIRRTGARTPLDPEEVAQMTLKRWKDRGKRAPTEVGTAVKEYAKAKRASDEARDELRDRLVELGVTDETATEMAEAARERLLESMAGTRERTMVYVDLEDGESVVATAKAMGASRGDKLDMLREFWYSAYLSGLKTQVVNLANYPSHLIMNSGLTRTMAAIINSAFGVVGMGDKLAPQLGELGSMWKAAAPGVTDAARLAVKSWQTGVDFLAYDKMHDQLHSGAAGEDPVKLLRSMGMELPPEAIPGLAGKVIRSPMRGMQFMDVFGKTVIAHMEAAAWAYRLAKQEQRGMEFTTPEAKQADLEDRMATLMEPGSAAWRRAVAEATEAGFQTPLRGPNSPAPRNAVDSVERALAGILGKLDEALGKKGEGPTGKAAEAAKLLLKMVLFPFMKTPYNIARITLRKSPLGIVPFLARTAEAGIMHLRGKRGFTETFGKFFDHAAEQVLAWTAYALLRGITEGDPDDDDKELLLTGGPLPGLGDRAENMLRAARYGGDFTLRYGDRETGTKVPYGRYEPVAGVLGTIADMIRASKMDADPAQKISRFTAGMIGQMESKTFLQGLSNAIQLADDVRREDGKRLGSFSHTVLASLVPNAIKATMRDTDDTVREWRTAEPSYRYLPRESAAQAKVLPATGQEVTKEGPDWARLLVPTGADTSAPLPAWVTAVSNYNARRPSSKFEDGGTWAPDLPGRKLYGHNGLPSGKAIELKPEAWNYLLRATGAEAARRLSGVVTAAEVRNPSQQTIERIRKVYAEAADRARDRLRSRPVATLVETQ